MALVTYSSMSCKWMKEALHSIKFQVIIVILVALDVGIVLFELLLDVGAFGKLVITVVHGVHTILLALLAIYIYIFF